MNKNDAGLQYLKNLFSRLKDAKLKKGFFGCPQIRELTRNKNFVKLWHHFLENAKADNFRHIIPEVMKLSAHKALECNMSLKLIFETHLDLFSEHLCAVSDELRFAQKLRWS